MHDSFATTVLADAAYRGYTELCVILLSSLPPADRLRLILVDKRTALHLSADMGCTNTVSGILNCLTADQKLQLLFTHDSDGQTALHYAAKGRLTKTAKTMLDNLTPDQPRKLLSALNNISKTASQGAVFKETRETLKYYRRQAEYRLNYH